MSSTSVKVKAPSARSAAMPSMTGSASGAYGARRQDDGAVAKTAGASGGDAAEHAKSASPVAGDAAKSEPSAFDDIAEKARPYLDKHGHAVVYGIVGIVAAVLILTIGFWPVLLLAVFAAIGIAIGKFRDSGVSMQTAARSLVGSLRR